MSIDRTAFRAALLALTLAVLPRVEAGEVLSGVTARGVLRCGVADIQAFPARCRRTLARVRRGFLSCCGGGGLERPERSRSYPGLCTFSHCRHAGSTCCWATPLDTHPRSVLGVQFPGSVLRRQDSWFRPPPTSTLADLDGATVCVEKGTLPHPGGVFKAKAGPSSRWSSTRRPAAEASSPAAVVPLPRMRPNWRPCGCVRRGPQHSRSSRTISGTPQPRRLGRRSGTTVVRWVLNVLILAERRVTRDNLDAVIADKTTP
jgi:hypothetical protein